MEKIRYKIIVLSENKFYETTKEWDRPNTMIAAKGQFDSLCEFVTTKKIPLTIILSDIEENIVLLYKQESIFSFENYITSKQRIYDRVYKDQNHKQKDYNDYLDLKSVLCNQYAELDKGLENKYSANIKNMLPEYIF